MKKVLAILGGLFLVVIVLCAGILFWAQSAGEEHQQRFFAAVGSGNPQQVLDLLDAELRKSVDARMLGAWMTAVAENLGAFQGLSKADFNTSTKIENGVKRTESSGTVRFAKGEANSELVFLNDKLAGFHVESTAIPDDWYAQARIRVFLATVASADAPALLRLFHPALQEEVDEPLLAAWLKEVASRLGSFDAIEKVEFQTLTSPEGGRRLAAEGSATFHEGTATFELHFIDQPDLLFVADELVMKFNVKSDKIGTDWYRNLTDTSAYHKRGEEFLRAFGGEDPKTAFAMMHEGLQEALPLEKLEAMISRVKEMAGPLSSVAYKSEKIETNEQGPVLRVYYDVKFKMQETTAVVDFQLLGLKGHLLAFNLSGETE